MKEIYYTYNNEAIASCIFLELLQAAEIVDFAKACLVLPLLLDDRTVKYLQRWMSEENINLEQIIEEKRRLFTTFNKRYLSLLPITINSLILLSKNNQIKITTSEICGDRNFSCDEVDMGNRFNEIKKVIPVLVKILEKYSTVQLYRILNVQL